MDGEVEVDGDLRQHGFKKLKALFVATTLLITTTPAYAGNLVADKSCQEKLTKKQEELVEVSGMLEYFAKVLLNNEKDPQAREMARKAKLEAGNVLYSKTACHELQDLTETYQSQGRKAEAEKSRSTWKRLCANHM
jgi:hypothetical protein